MKRHAWLRPRGHRATLRLQAEAPELRGRPSFPVGFSDVAHHIMLIPSDDVRVETVFRLWSLP